MDDDYECDDLDVLTSLLDEEQNGSMPPGFSYDDDDHTSSTSTQSSQCKKSQRSSDNDMSSTQDPLSSDDDANKSKEDLMEEIRLMKEKLRTLEKQAQHTPSKASVAVTPQIQRRNSGINPISSQETKRKQSSKFLEAFKDLSPPSSSIMSRKDSGSSPELSKNKRTAHTPKSQSCIQTVNSPYRCQLCNKSFFTLEEFKSHEYQHQKNNPLKCDLCMKTFNSEISLKMHHQKLHADKVSSPAQKKLERTDNVKLPSGRPSASGMGGLTSGNKNSQFKSNRGVLAPAMKPKEEDEDGNWETEVYSQIRIINPLISSEMMKIRMSGRRMVRMSVISKHVKSGKVDGDWVTIGVLVNKIPPKTSSNGKAYSIWKLNDLINVDVVVTLFLFGEVHKEHWKLSVGTVIGLLNAEVMSKKDGLDESTLKVDHAQKIMLLGKSKDLGWCKGRRKDGRDCTMFVNKTECEFCQYHVQSAYKKMSSKRTDLQASYVGPQPRAFKEQMMWLINYCIYVHIMPFSHHDRYVGPQPRAFKEQMKKGTIFYGGQTYTSQSSSGKKVKKETKTLKNLDLSKAKQLQEADKMNMLKIHRLSTTESAEFIGVANGNEQFQERLVVPTVGSQNLLKHMKTTEETEKVKNGLIESVSASDLIKIHKKDLLERKRAQKRKLSAVTSPNVPLPPMLGRGVGDDQQVFLDFSPPSKSSAKSRATAFWKSKGPASRDDPNAVGKKITPDKVTQINKRVERDRRLSQDESPPSEQPRKKKKFLGTDLSEIDKHSEEFQNMVKAKSKHSELVHEVEADLQEKYFQELEKKEKLETRATSIMEKVCKVVSCKQCQYTYFSPSERCKKENHSLKWHETKQRYYQCKKCKTRMFTFNMLPTGSCRNCGNTQFERTGMMSERKVPKLESETLLLRGEELKYVST